MSLESPDTGNGRADLTAGKGTYFGSRKQGYVALAEHVNERCRSVRMCPLAIAASRCKACALVPNPLASVLAERVCADLHDKISDKKFGAFSQRR